MKIKKTLAIALSVAFLSACGGGGSGDVGGGQTPVNKYSKVGNFPITDCVKDNITGLTWEGKTSSGLRDGLNQYSNFDSINSNQRSWIPNSAPYTPILSNVTQEQIDAATNSIGYKNYVNSIALCGYTDWRMPNFEELNGLVHGDSSGTSNLDVAWFPKPFFTPLWTSSGIGDLYPNQDYPYLAKFVISYPSSNPVRWHDRGASNFVRLVR